MKKVEKFIKDVVSDIAYEMKFNIECGFDHLCWEKEYENALIGVEIKEVRLRNGFYIDDVDVYVQHDNPEHTSPNIEKAIKEALPDWFDLKYEIEKQIA